MQDLGDAPASVELGPPLLTDAADLLLAALAPLAGHLNQPPLSIVYGGRT